MPEQSFLGRNDTERTYSTGVAVSEENKQGILFLTIKDRAVLYAAYMPFVRNGGLFVPTNKRYELGEEVFILLALMDEPEKIPSTVRWCGLRQKALKAIARPELGCSFRADFAAAQLKSI